MKIACGNGEGGRSDDVIAGCHPAVPATSLNVASNGNAVIIEHGRPMLQSPDGAHRLSRRFGHHNIGVLMSSTINYPTCTVNSLTPRIQGANISEKKTVTHGWKISYFRKYQNIETIKNIDIFQKMKISNKLHNNGWNTLMHYFKFYLTAQYVILDAIQCSILT